MKKIMQVIAISSVIGSSFALAETITPTHPLEHYVQTAEVTYQCGDNKVAARFYEYQQNNIVLLATDEPAPTLLVNVMSADGAKYVGGIYELWTKGDNATLSNFLTPDHSLECTQAK